MLTLGLFGVGHLLVAVVATLFIRLLHRQPNLLARREAIFELNSRPMRIEAAQAELVTSKAEAAALDKRIARADAKIADALPLDDPPSTVAAYGLVAGILPEAEAGLVWLLSGPVRFLSLSSEAWGFAAPPFAAAWIVLMHVLLGWAVADKHRPARTIRRAKVGAGLCGGAVIIGAWLTLSGRNLTDTAVIEQMAGAGLMILAGLVSVCAAFCSLVATTLLEAQHHERERARLVALRDQYTNHIDLIEKDLARLLESSGPEGQATKAPAPEPPNKSPAAAPAVPVGIIPTALMLICLIGMPGLVRAQLANPQSITAEAPARSSTPSFARLNGCEFLPDITSSVDRLPLKSTLSQTADMMTMIIDRFNCAVVRVTPFAGDLFVSIDEILIPAVENAAARCQAEQPNTTSARAKALGLLYPSVAAAHQQQATDAARLRSSKPAKKWSPSGAPPPRLRPRGCAPPAICSRAAPAQPCRRLSSGPLSARSTSSRSPTASQPARRPRPPRVFLPTGTCSSWWSRPAWCRAPTAPTCCSTGSAL